MPMMYVLHGEKSHRVETEQQLNEQRREPDLPELDAATAAMRNEKARPRRRDWRRAGKRASQRPASSASRRERSLAPSAAVGDSDGDLVQRYLAVVQQTTAANRAIGRLNFERDALARQVETLRRQRGLAPASPEAPVPTRLPASPDAAQSRRSVLAAWQRFLNDGDIWHVRMRRMGLVFGLLAVVALAWAVSRAGIVVFPAKVSRDSLGDLPFVGTTLRFAMGVWSMFRVVRIGARGVRWAFPEERSRRRRR